MTPSVLVLIMNLMNIQVHAQDTELERRVDKTVREMGVVESASSSEIRSPVESKIRSIVKEGTLVHKGDLLLTLQEPVSEQQLEKLKISEAQADAKIAEIRHRLESLRLGSMDEISLYEITAKVAKLNLDRFTSEGGELDLRRKQSEAELSLARQRLKTLKEIVERTSRQIERGISSPIDLAEIQLELLEAQLQVDTAVRQLEHLEQHVAPHETAVRELEFQTAQIELNRKKREVDSQIRVLEAELQAAERSSQAIAVQAARIQSRNLVADRSGIVIYENQTYSRTARETPLAVGSQVKENQILMRVVDLNKLQLKVGVHESKIARVKAGQPVVIRLDAFPQQKFTGEVLKISQTPEIASWPNYNHKEYAVTVSFNNPPESLKLGLTALAEIETSVEK